MIGKTISHYKITEKLGEGGMGEVYLADDTKLKRQVAIKFLPEHLTKDKENIERFEREAEAAAALNHPNIVTIYNVLEEDNQLCIVMEYVDGKSLRDVINEYDLGLDKIIDIISQLSEGLSKAHKAGIVHRDIKPENIIIDQDARVKILDFGLAKLKGVSKLTKETSTLGTIHYMSPEQIQGKDVDHRSDIWSVGVVLYELLTGEPPFKGDYEQAVTYAILNEEPKLLKDIESKYSANISSIITKMILKERENRYQSCLDLIDDLKRVSDAKPQRKKSLSKSIYTIAGLFAVAILLISTILYFYPKKDEAESLKSIGVIPFSNTKNDTENDYLEEAIAAEIIRDLAYFKNINVIPFSTIQRLKDWKDLNVDYRLTGNFFMENNAIRLNIELVDSKTEEIEWQGSLEDEFKNSFKLLDDVSEKVIKGLRIKFSNDEQERMKKDVPQNSLAYEYYLQSLSYDLSNEGNTIALNLLLKSIEIDSSYAPAFSELGYRKRLQTQNYLIGRIGSDRARGYFLKALELNNEHLSALIELSAIDTDLGKHDAAMKNLTKALEINPNDALAHFRLSYIYRFVGLLEKSEKSAKRALQLDSQNLRFRSIGHTYRYLGNYQKSLESYSIDSSAWADAQRGDIYLKMDSISQAENYLEKVIEKETDTFPEFLAKGMLAYIRNEKDEGLKIIRKWEEKDLYDSEMIYRIAANYGLFGETSRCTRVLKKTINGGFFCYSFFLTDPFLDPVRDDPEFQEVLALAKKRHEAFKQEYFPEIE